MHHKANSWLLEFRKNHTSQFGEDGVIKKIFEILPTPNAERWCVEFGAGDGLFISNTYTLINNEGWSSVQIEANPEFFKNLFDRYKENPRVHCIQEEISFEGENSLDHVLSSTPLPYEFDFLSIDIDGNDYHIWESLEKFRPKVVMIEFNMTIPNHVEFIQPKDMRLSQGSSLLANTRLAQRKGYELIAATDCNGFFVDAKYFPLFEIQDNSIWSIYQNYNYVTHVFQLFDGTIVVGGFNRLYWHQMELDLEEVQQEIQVIPEELRGYPPKF